MSCSLLRDCLNLYYFLKITNAKAMMSHEQNFISAACYAMSFLECSVFILFSTIFHPWNGQLYYITFEHYASGRS